MHSYLSIHTGNSMFVYVGDIKQCLNICVLYIVLCLLLVPCIYVITYPWSRVYYYPHICTYRCTSMYLLHICVVMYVTIHIFFLSHVRFYCVDAFNTCTRLARNIWLQSAWSQYSQSPASDPTKRIENYANGLLHRHLWWWRSPT